MESSSLFSDTSFWPVVFGIIALLPIFWAIALLTYASRLPEISKKLSDLIDLIEKDKNAQLYTNHKEGQSPESKNT